MIYDLAIIGGGPGGYVAAIIGAQQGLKVLLIEKDVVGGTCLNRGCIPTKCLIYDSKIYRDIKKSSVLKGVENIDVDVTKIVERKRKVVSTMVEGLNKILDSNRVRVMMGSGEITGPGEVRLVEKINGLVSSLHAQNIILATGSRPAVPSPIKIDGHFIQTTDDALDAEDVPKNMVIIGGGVVGIEMASIYLSLGSSVTIIELLPDILANEDEELRRIMMKILAQQGASFILNAKVKDVTIINGGIDLIYEDESKTLHSITTDRVLVATGRKPVLEGINVSKLKIEMNGSFIKVNSRLLTNLPGVHAIGDLVGGLMLAHKAMAEAETVVSNLTGHKRAIRYELIPRCIWGLTEIGAVGLTEKEARAGNRQIRIGKFYYANSGAAQVMGKRDGLVKIVGDAQSGELLGVHILGEQATNLISEAVTVINMEGTVEDLYEVIKPHPTLSETIFEAARDWNDISIHALKKQS